MNELIVKICLLFRNLHHPLCKSQCYLLHGLLSDFFDTYICEADLNCFVNYCILVAFAISLKDWIRAKEL